MNLISFWFSRATGKYQMKWEMCWGNWLNGDEVKWNFVWLKFYGRMWLLNWAETSSIFMEIWMCFFLWSAGAAVCSSFLLTGRVTKFSSFGTCFFHVHSSISKETTGNFNCEAAAAFNVLFFCCFIWISSMSPCPLPSHPLNRGKSA